MNVERGPSASRRTSRAPAALASVGCVLGVVVGLRLFLSLPEASACAERLLGGPPSVLGVAMLGVLLFWMGFGPASLGLMMLGRPRSSLGLPVWAVLLAGTFLVLFRLAGPGLSLGDLAGGETARLVLVFSYAALILLMSSTAAGAVSLLEWPAASRGVLSLLLLGLPWVALVHLILLSRGVGEGSMGPVRSEPFGGEAFLVLLALTVSANGAALGYALRRPRAWGAATALAVTALLVVPGWFLLQLGLAPQVRDGGAAWSTIQWLLAAGPDTSVGWWGLFLRWAAVQVGLVLVLALGHRCALGLWRAAATEEADAGKATGPEGAPIRAVAGGGRSTGHPGRAYLVLALGYAVLVVYGSLVPLDYHARPFEEALEAFVQTPYLHLGIGNRSDLVANLLLFIPLSFLMMGALTREDSGSRLLAALVAAAVTVVLSVGIEFVQLFFPPRTVSLNDVLAECAGGAAGVALWLAVGRRITEWWRGLVRADRPARLAALLLTGYVACLVVYQLFPYDLVLSADEMIQELREGKLVLVPLTDISRTSILGIVRNIVIHIPVGYWIVVRWRCRRRPVLAGVWGGLVFVGAIELLQMFVYSRYSSATDVVLGAWGAGVGGLLAARFGPMAGRPLPDGFLWRCVTWAVRLAGTAAVLAALVWGKWSPLAPQWPDGGVWAGLLRAARVPFYYQYFNSEFAATGQLLADVAVPAALGVMMMSLASGLRGGRLLAAVMAATVAAAVELGQMCFPPHVPDMTTACLAAAGGVLGTFLYRPFVKCFVRPGYGIGSEKVLDST